MAKLWLATLLALPLAIAGCGSSGTANIINGKWTATLTNANGSLAYQFSATFAQGSDNNLNITNLMFTDPGTCMFSGENGAAGSFTPPGQAFTMSMLAGEWVGAPSLSLQGTLNKTMISGTWITEGTIPNCGGSGNFTIQPAPQAQPAV